MSQKGKQKAFLEIAQNCLESLHLIYMPYFTLQSNVTHWAKIKISISCQMLLFYQCLKIIYTGPFSVSFSHSANCFSFINLDFILTKKLPQKNYSSQFFNMTVLKSRFECEFECRSFFRFSRARFFLRTEFFLITECGYITIQMVFQHIVCLLPNYKLHA